MAAASQRNAGLGGRHHSKQQLVYPTLPYPTQLVGLPGRLLRPRRALSSQPNEQADMGAQAPVRSAAPDATQAGGPGHLPGHAAAAAGAQSGISTLVAGGPARRWDSCCAMLRPVRRQAAPRASRGGSAAHGA